jgi:hypothetical protein
MSNIDYDSFFESRYTEMSYRVQGYMASRSNELCHDSNHCIVCQNEHISNTRMHPEMASDVHIGSFPFSRTKNVFSIFGVRENGLFVKQLLK